MLLTFIYYHILTAVSEQMANRQLVPQSNFDQEVVQGVIAELLVNKLLITCTDKRTGTTFYKLTELGEASLETYERENPALIIRRTGG
ncbi:hypothetical protein GCM10028825_08150 [Spirosoma agri]|jgi:predicted transcriptional regulator